MFEHRQPPTSEPPTTLRLRAGWTRMLDGTSRPKIHDYVPDGIRSLRESSLTGRNDPDPVNSRLA